MSSMAGRAAVTGPMKSDTARRMRRTAQMLDDSHPEMVTGGHVRDAAKVLEHGSTEGAKRHLDAAMETLVPRNLMRHGILDDDGHALAKHHMHQINRHRLAVMDIEDVSGRNQQLAQAKQQAAQQAKLAGQQAATAKQMQRAGQKANQLPGGQDPGLFSSNLPGRTLELSARTAMLQRTPAPRGKPGGPGLYDVKGMGHDPYFQQVVKALIEKRGMPPEKAYPIAYAALRKWRRGGGHTHPEVQAAASGTLASEAAKGASARASHGHSNWQSVLQAIDLAAQGSGGGGGGGGQQGQKQGGNRPQSSNYKSQSRVQAGSPQGGQFGPGSGGGQQGKGKHPHNAQARAARKAQLQKKAAGIRAQIHALQIAYKAAVLSSKHKTSRKAAKAGKAVSPKAAAAAAARKAAAGKSKTSTPRKKTTAMSPATIHAKIIMLRGILSNVMAQIHAL